MEQAATGEGKIGTTVSKENILDIRARRTRLEKASERFEAWILKVELLPWLFLYMFFFGGGGMLGLHMGVDAKVWYPLIAAPALIAIAAGGFLLQVVGREKLEMVAQFEGKFSSSPGRRIKALKDLPDEQAWRFALPELISFFMSYEDKEVRMLCIRKLVPFAEVRD